MDSGDATVEINTMITPVTKIITKSSSDSKAPLENSYNPYKRQNVSHMQHAHSPSIIAGGTPFPTSSSSSPSTSMSELSSSYSPLYSDDFQVQNLQSSPLVSSSSSPDLETMIINELSTISPSPHYFTTITLLDSLPSDLSMRIMCMLPVPSLCALSCCNRTWNSFSSDSAIWSEMYVKRWSVDSVNRLGEPWKQLYKDRDERERNEFLSMCSDDPETLPFFQQWASEKSKQRRSKKLRDVDEFELIETWRNTHHMQTTKFNVAGANNGSVYGNDPSSLLPDHTCNRDLCTYYHPEVSDQSIDLYICEQTGLVHFCGATCEQLTKFQHPRCSISGRWRSTQDRNLDEIPTDRCIHEDEEDIENGENDDTFYTNGIFLSACFEYGYSQCNNEEQAGDVLHELHNFRRRC
jgi:hypothetical protein